MYEFMPSHTIIFARAMHLVSVLHATDIVNGLRSAEEHKQWEQ